MASVSGSSYNLTRHAIVQRARRNPQLVRDFVRKACAEQPGDPPETERGWAGTIARQIESAIANLVGHESAKPGSEIPATSYPDAEIVVLHKLTLSAIQILGYLCERAGDDFDYRCHRFYAEMVFRGGASHQNETIGGYPEAEEGVRYLLSENKQGGIIPQKIDGRYPEEWTKVERLASAWNWGLSLTDAKAQLEMIPIMMGIEVNTGGNPNHTKPYKKYLDTKMSKYLNELQKADALSEDDVDRRS